MAETTYDQAWLENWAAQQNYTDSGSASWLVISQVMPNFPNHSVHIAPTEDDRYIIVITGPTMDGTPVYLTRK